MKVSSDTCRVHQLVCILYISTGEQFKIQVVEFSLNLEWRNIVMLWQQKENPYISDV